MFIQKLDDEELITYYFPRYGASKETSIDYDINIYWLIPVIPVDPCAARMGMVVRVFLVAASNKWIEKKTDSFEL